MAYPPSYERDFSFTEFETLNPGQPKPGNALDAEFDDVSVALTATQDNLALIQRDDGQLANNSVGEDQLQDDVLEGIVDGITAEAEAARDAAQGHAAAAAISATNADTSADAALTSEGNAAGSAALAGASQTIAQDAANQAELSAQDAAVSANESASAANLATGAVAEVESSVELAYRWAEYLAAPVMPAPDGYPEAVDDGMWSAKWWALRARDYNQLSYIDFGSSAAGDIGEAYDEWGGTLPPGNVIVSWNGDEYWLIAPETPSDPNSWIKLTGDTGATGATGPANELSIGTVTTLPPGSPATATITGTPPSQTLSLGIPQGEVGSGGSGAGGNPTALVGLTPIPGVSLELIRSDGAPALNQAIAPTWTGEHIFAAKTQWFGFTAADVATIKLSPSGGVWGGNDALLADSSARVVRQNAQVAFTLSRVNGTYAAMTPLIANDTIGLITFKGSRATSPLGFGGSITATALETWSDTSTPAGIHIRATPVGGVADQVVASFTAAGTMFNGPITSTHNGTSASPALLIASAQPQFVLRETDAPVDTQNWDFSSSAGAFRIRAVNDANNNSGVALSIARTGYAVTSFEFGNATNNPTYAFLGTGIATFNGRTIFTTGAVTGPVSIFDSAAANGPYLTLRRSGVAFADIGNGGQMGAGYALDAVAIVARAGFALQLAANGSTTPQFQITATGDVVFNTSALTWNGSSLVTAGMDANVTGDWVFDPTQWFGLSPADVATIKGTPGLGIWNAGDPAVFQGAVWLHGRDATSVFVIDRINGSYTTQTAQAANTGIGLISFRASKGSPTPGVAGSIRMFSDGAFTDSSTPGQLRFYVCPTGSTVEVQVATWTPAAIAFTSTALTHNGNVVPHVASSPTWTGAHTHTPPSGLAMTINAAPGNNAIVINGAANQWSAVIEGSTTSGQSYGLRVGAGTTTADIALGVTNRSGTPLLTIRGDGQIQIADGSLAVPALSFLGDTDTGIWRAGVNDMRLSAGSATIAQIASGGGAFLFGDGSAAGPFITFYNDQDTGLYRVAANTMAFSAGGTIALAIDAGGGGGRIQLGNGAAATPSYTFYGDTDTGAYWPGADSFGIASGGTPSFIATTNFLIGRRQWVGINGTALAPALSFENGATNGFYYDTTNTVGVGLAGVSAYLFAPTAFVGRGGRALQLNNAANDAAGVVMNTGGAGNTVLAFQTGGASRLDIGISNITASVVVNAPAFNVTSARALKRETGKPSRIGDLLKKLRPIFYRLLAGDDREQLGLIAEEVHAVCPQLSDGKTISYDRLAILLLAEWQESHGVA